MAVTISCAATGSNPVLTVREIMITLTGQLANDASVTRTLQESVRIRGTDVRDNDHSDAGIRGQVGKKYFQRF